MTSRPLGIDNTSFNLAMDLITDAVNYRKSPIESNKQKFQVQHNKVISRIKTLSARKQPNISSASKQISQQRREIGVYGGALNISEEMLTTILRKPDLHERIHDMKEILTADLSEERKKIIQPSIQAGVLILTIALGLSGSITGLFFSFGTLIPLLLSGLAVTFTTLGLTLFVVYMNSFREFANSLNRFTQLNDITLKSLDLMQRFAIDQYVIIHSLTSYTESISAEWTIIIMAIYGLEEDVIKFSRAHTRQCRWPLSPASQQVVAVQGHPFSRAHFRHSRCPFFAAKWQVLSSQGHPFSRSQRRISRWPPFAAV